MLKTSFSSKIALFTCFFVLLTGVVVAMSFSVESHKAMVDHEKQIIANHLEDEGSIIAGIISNAKIDTQFLSSLDSIKQYARKSIDPVSSKQFIANFLQKKIYYHSLTIYRSNGPGLHYRLDQEGKLVIDSIAKGIPKELLQIKGELKYQPIKRLQRDREKPVATMGLTMALYFGKEQTAAFQININFNKLLSSLTHIKNSQELYISNSEGDLMVHPDARLKMDFSITKYSIQEIFPDLSPLFAGEEVSGGDLLIKRNGQDLVVFYERIAIGMASSRAIYFITLVPYDQLIEKPMGILTRSIMITLVLFIFSFLLVFLFAKSAVRDILRVASATKSFLQGNEASDLPLHRQDEIGSLAKMFQHMVQEYGKQSRALKDSEARYRKIVETTDEGVVVLDNEYRSQFINQRMADMLGYKLAELQGRSVYEFIDVDAHSLVIANHAHTSKNTQQFDIRLTRKNGSTLWCLVGISYLKGDDGEDMGILAMVNDISNRKLAEQATQQSQLRFQSLFEDAPIPLWESNFANLRDYLLRLKKDGIEDLVDYVLSNQDAQQTLHSKINILAMNCAAFSTFQVESVEEFVDNLPYFFRGDDIQKYISTLVDICVYGKNTQGEITFYTMRDEAVHVRYRTIMPVDCVDCSRILTGMVDISDRIRVEQALRESERQYALMASEQRILLEHTKDFVYRRDIAGYLTYISPAVTNITGYSEEEMDQPFHEYLTQDKMNQEYLNYCSQDQWNSELENLFRIEINSKLGPRVLEINERPFVEEGRVKYFVGVARDVSVRYGMELQLKHSQDELRELASHLHSAREEEQTRIAREIHDEFGQVLMALNMDIHWIKRHMPDDEQFTKKTKSMVNLINIATNTVQRLLNDLRPIILDDLGLGQALEWYVDEFSSRTRLECTLENGLSEQEFDKDFATTVFRLVQEALTNIVKHANATAVHIELVEDRSNLSIQIKDNGVGFKDIEREVGKSFGLIGMRERAMGMGGIIRITSEPGQGTMVWISLPLSRARVSIPA